MFNFKRKNWICKIIGIWGENWKTAAITADTWFEHGDLCTHLHVCTMYWLNLLLPIPHSTFKSYEQRPRKPGAIPGSIHEKILQSTSHEPAASCALCPLTCGAHSPRHYRWSGRHPHPPAQRRLQLACCHGTLPPVYAWQSRIPRHLNLCKWWDMHTNGWGTSEYSSHAIPTHIVATCTEHPKGILEPMQIYIVSA